MDRMHNIQHMKRQVAVRPMWFPGPQAISHIRYAQAPAVLRKPMTQRHLAPLLFRRPINPHRPAKRIRIRYAQRAFGAINLDPRHFRAPHIETGGNRPDWPAGKIHHPDHMSRNFNLDLGTIFRLAGNHPLWKANPC